jgi:hypothetical protein
MIEEIRQEVVPAPEIGEHVEEAIQDGWTIADVQHLRDGRIILSLRRERPGKAELIV